MCLVPKGYIHVVTSWFTGVGEGAVEAEHSTFVTVAVPGA